MHTNSNYYNNKSSGWISLYRSICNNPLWKSERFTRGQAWIDLLLLAKHRPGYFYQRGIKVNYTPGDVVEGEINLASRWQWARGTVFKFLKDLEDEQQIRQHRNRVITVVHILNFTEYQQKLTTDRTTDWQQTGQQIGNRTDNGLALKIKK